MDKIQKPGDSDYNILLNETNSLAISPQANCTNRAAAPWLPNFSGSGMSHRERHGSPRPLISVF
jgi:hypothetical protein